MIDQFHLAQLSGRLLWRRRRRRQQQRWRWRRTTSKKSAKRCDAAEPFPISRAESILKAELLSLIEYLQRNPAYEKGQGRPLPARGAPLTNLTTVKLSRNKVRKLQAESVWKVCFARFIQGSIYPPLTQPIRNAPNLYHCDLLIWSRVVKDGCLPGWSDLVVWYGGDGLFWWSDLFVGSENGLVWY